MRNIHYCLTNLNEETIPPCCDGPIYIHYYYYSDNIIYNM